MKHGPALVCVQSVFNPWLMHYLQGDTMRSKKSMFIGAVAIVAAVLALSVFGGKESPSLGAAQAVATPQDEVCARHQLPVAECFFCDPALREPGRLWCEEHEDSYHQRWRDNRQKFRSDRFRSGKGSPGIPRKGDGSSRYFKG